MDTDPTKCNQFKQLDIGQTGRAGVPGTRDRHSTLSINNHSTGLQWRFRGLLLPDMRRKYSFMGIFALKSLRVLGTSHLLSTAIDGRLNIN